MIQYVAFLRGINVGGHHKLPMPDLRSELESLKFTNIITVLNSGNVLFETTEWNLENLLSESLKKRFGFVVPVIIRKSENLVNLVKNNPFQNIGTNKDLRYYATFLKEEAEADLALPWTSPDSSFQILLKEDNVIFSVLDLSIAKTTKAMDVLEKFYGKGVTTRNWNTIIRIAEKINI